MRIVCLTSNGYVNCVQPFAHYWNHFAGSERPVLVAHYDLTPVALPENFETWYIGEQAAHSWSSGLLRLLMSGRIYDDFILLMLEDYFLSAPVNWKVAESLSALMRQDETIVKADLTDDRQKVPYTATGYFHAANLIVSDVDAPFQTSVQAAIWRKDFLCRFLDGSENAWQFEKQGTKRVIAARDTEWIGDMRIGKFKGQVVGTLNPPMEYANAVGGAGGKPGVIESKHMPGWMWQECVAKGWAR